MLRIGYLEGWLLCYQLALKYAIEDKRDVKLISDRYEQDLIQCMRSTDKWRDFCKLFNQEKQKFVQNNILNINLLTHVSHYTQNMEALWDLFSYCFRNSQSMSNVFYAKFKKKYNNMSIFCFKKIMNEKVRYYCREFIIVMRPFIENIIKKNSLSDDDAKLLYCYLIVEERFPCREIIRLPVNIFPVYYDKLEQILYDEIEINKYKLDQICKFLLSEEFFESRPQSPYYKFLSFKRIIVYLWRHQKKSTILPFLCAIFFGFLYVCIKIEENLPKKDLCASLCVTFAFLHLIFSCEIPFYLFRARFFIN